MGCYGNYRMRGAPGRDAELRQAFVVIKTECQAEEGWQGIKVCVSQHVFQGVCSFKCL